MKTTDDKRALRLLRAYHHRFGDSWEFGKQKPDGNLTRPNPRGLPGQYNPFSGNFEYAVLSDHKLKQHLNTGDLYIVHCGQTRREAWLTEDALVELGAVLGLGDHPNLYDLRMADADDPSLSVGAAWKHLIASEGNKGWNDLFGQIDPSDSSMMAELKRRLLLASGTEFYLARRMLTRFSGIVLEPRPVYEIVIDTDGGRAANGHKLPKDITRPAAQELTAAIQLDLTPPGVAVYSGPSTGGGGEHTRLQIQDESCDFEIRNAFITYFQQYLQQEYVDERGHAHIDVVRGLNCHWEDNPHWWSNYQRRPDWADPEGAEPDRVLGEIYDAAKVREGPGFSIDPDLERLHHVHSGDLITMPLHPQDRTVPGQLDRFEQFLNGEPMPQQEWAEAVGFNLDTGTIHQPKAMTTVPDAALSNPENKRLPHSSVYVLSGDVGSVEGLGAAADGLQLPRMGSKAHQALVDVSMRFLSRRSLLAAYAVRLAKGERSQAVELTLKLWELPGGPCSGRPRHAGRVRKAKEDVDFWIKGRKKQREYKLEAYNAHYAGPGAEDNEGPRIPVEAILERMEEVRQNREAKMAIRWANGRHSHPRHGAVLDDHLLAVAMEFWCLDICSEGLSYSCPRTGRKKISKRGEVPARGIQQILLHFGCPANRIKSTAAAAREALEQMGQIVKVGNAYVGDHDSGCRRWKFGRHFTPLAWAIPHLRPEDFVVPVEDLEETQELENDPSPSVVVDEAAHADSRVSVVIPASMCWMNQAVNPADEPDLVLPY